MDKNLEWPVEINISIPKEKGISILGLVLHLGLRLKQASSIHVSGISTLGLKELSVLNDGLFTSEDITEMFESYKAVGFSVLGHFCVDTDKNIPEAWGDGDLYSGDILVNKHGVHFLIKLSKKGEKLQFVPIGEKHVFNPKDKLICLAGNIA